MRLQPQRAWLNDRWRNLRGYTARDGTWRFVGASAAVTALLSGAVIAGGGWTSRSETATPATEARLVPSSRSFNDWAGYRGPTTTQAPTTTVARPAPVVKHTAPPRASRSRQGSGACGGDLPPCCVLAGESGGNLTAHNASGADGKWQFMPGTWNSQDGNMRDGGYTASDGHTYASPSSAPESVQDEAARHLYAGGAGRGHWSARC